MGWNAVVTNAGAELISQLTVPGNTLVISRVQTGSGTVDTSAMKAATSLKTPVATGDVTSVSPITGGSLIWLNIGPHTATYNMKEVGIFAKIGESGTEALTILIQNDGAGVDVPLASEFPDFSMRLSVPVAITNTAQIEFEVPSAAYVTNAEFEEAIQGIQTGKKGTQTPVSDPEASGDGDSFIAAISQDAQGVITPLKKNVRVMGAATATAAGTKGLVPAPGAGKNMSFLRGDGVWTQPENTTYPTMTGATSESAGVAGLVPAPAIGEQVRYLRGDGTWATPDNTTYSVFTGATSGTAGTAGLVKAPAAGEQDKFLRGDGSWAVVTTSPMTGASSSADGASGLVPKPISSNVAQFLRGDGTWATPTNTTYSGGTGITLSGTTFSLSSGVITAGSYGPTANVNGANGNTIKVPQITVDTYGRVTSIVERVYTSVNTDTNTTYSGGTGISLSGTTFSLSTSGVSAGTYGPSGNVSGTNGTTINVPQITVDAYGRVTSITNRVYTSVNTDTNTTYSVFSGATASAAGSAGLVKAPAKGEQGLYLRGDGKWATPTNTTYSSLAAASGGTAVSLVTTGEKYTWGHIADSALKTSGNFSASGVFTFTNTTAASSTSTGAVKVSGGLGVAGNIYGAKVYHSVWNDYAECRKADTIEPGRCVAEAKGGVMKKTTERLQPGCKIVSDTFGACMGETATAKTPVAVAGRVLAYPARDRELFNLGDAVCSGPNGTVDIMTREEIREYPERIVGTVSEIPEYAIWVGGTEKDPKEIRVDGRIWIYVR